VNSPQGLFPNRADFSEENMVLNKGLKHFHVSAKRENASVALKRKVSE
jgi:hypothetical protein